MQKDLDKENFLGKATSSISESERLQKIPWIVFYHDGIWNLSCFCSTNYWGLKAGPSCSVTLILLRKKCDRCHNWSSVYHQSHANWICYSCDLFYPPR